MSPFQTRVISRAVRSHSIFRQSTQGPAFRRYAHGHAEHQEIPFSTENKKALAAKCVAYMGTGFMIPFIAVYYTLTKNKGKGDN
ncbi:hypothetical protein JR316_0012648 [Psilocybe cubensis]|uniref:Cytochrome c oxidase subunit 8, mitochondrial n=2 Tax=Psilocybe cubensis TaxID=181762 RepID=A0A8H7XNF7_PSICU|nr:hypothetical protein JR316_0012648 [Psilocybe cubensis]KAH9475533.1 hypothetical protein JR316_0012648 [Psilocybe cubensis]